MKYIFGIGILVFMFFFSSCSLDDVLKPSDDIYITILETQDTVGVIPGDTISFKFLVSTNGGAIKRIEIMAQEELFSGIPDKMTFSMVDTALGLTADAEGYLSRPVSTVMVNYPVHVKPNPSMLGKVTSVSFKATSSQDNIDENRIEFALKNHRTYNEVRQFYPNYSYSSGNIFFNPYDYSCHRSSYATGEEATEENKEKVALVCATKWADGKQRFYLMDPSATETGEILSGWPFNLDYDTTAMKPTLFYKLEGVGGSVLDEDIAKETDLSKKMKLITERDNMDKIYFETLGDSYLEQLDFSEAVRKYEITETGGLFAFRTWDGRHGIIGVSYPNVFDNNIPMQVKYCKYQAMSTESEVN